MFDGFCEVGKPLAAKELFLIMVLGYDSWDDKLLDFFIIGFGLFVFVFSLKKLVLDLILVRVVLVTMGQQQI